MILWWNFLCTTNTVAHLLCTRSADKHYKQASLQFML